MTGDTAWFVPHGGEGRQMLGLYMLDPHGIITWNVFEIYIFITEIVFKLYIQFVTTFYIITSIYIYNLLLIATVNILLKHVFIGIMTYVLLVYTALNISVHNELYYIFIVMYCTFI